MDFPKWAMEDGAKLADVIYKKIEEKGILSIDEVFDIYDNFEIPILRKVEGATWEILRPKVTRVKDDENRVVAFTLKQIQE